MKASNNSVVPFEGAAAELEKSSPKQPAKEPVVVPLKTGLTVFNIDVVDSQSQHFVADLFCCVTAYYEDLDRAGISRPQDFIAQMHGKLQWLNAVNEDNEVRWRCTDIPDAAHPMIQWTFRGRQKFLEVLELARFPFDHQELSFQLTTEIPTVSGRTRAGQGVCVKLMPVATQHPLRFRADSFVLTEIWHYLGYLIKSELSAASWSCTGNQYTNLSFCLCFKRRATYYISNIWGPVFVLTSLGFIQYALPVEEYVADRISVGVTLLLTSAAYKIVIASSLPAVSYLTFIDRYVLGSFFLLILLTIEPGIAIHAEDPQELDRWAAVALACVWVLFHVWVIVVAYGTGVVEEWAMKRHRLRPPLPEKPAQEPEYL